MDAKSYRRGGEALSLALLDDIAAVCCAGQFNAVLAPYASVKMTCDI
jgi:hypothetical protein